MELVHRCCAGLDVHKDTVVCCLRVAKGRRATSTVRTFGTTTSALLELREWLESQGCEAAVMEATGVYWKPVWHILEGAFELILANAHHVKQVTGRKTDVKDAEWLAELLAHGLVRSSFVPPEPIREIRTLTRTRKQLTREVVKHTQRIQKTLEDANVKITGVLSDIMGLSGRSMIEAMISGKTDPETLAKLGHPRLKADPIALREGLRGRITKHHRFMLKLHLDQIDHLRDSIATLDEELTRVMEPFRAAEELLITAPGIHVDSARMILGEIGVDMSAFPTVEQFRSWACLCPRNDESAGKRRSTRTRRGGTWLKTTLVQCAWGAVRTKNSYFRAQYHRIKARRGPKKAIVAVAASLLTAIYHMLKTGCVYEDLGPEHFDTLNKEKTVNRLVKRLQSLGYEVTVEPAA